MLTIQERDFLTRLRDKFAASGSFALCKSNPPSPKLQGLVDRGYCKLSPVRSGPLGVLTGEVMIGLTEAGRGALDQQPAAVAA
jgi:hypothetical protein